MDEASAMPGPGPDAPLRIGQWRVFPALDELALGARRSKIEPRCMRLLLALAREPGRVCGVEALLDEVWPGLVVTSNSLYQAVAELRRVLQQDRATGAFIATVPRKGYRLVAPVGVQAPPGPAPAVPAARDLGPRSVAVLPFRARGLPDGLAFLRESLLGDLIAELSRQPQLATIARGTMLTYADQAVDYRRLATQLGVQFVVDGSVDAAGDAGALRIVAELVDAASGQQIWSETLALPRDAWPTLGAQVVGRLARVLNLELAAGALRRTDRAAAGGTDALGTALKAWVELYCRPQTRDTNDRAWHWVRSALQADDSLGIAWNALAYCEWRAAQYGWHRRPRDELLADAMQHAARAVELDPRDPDAPYTMALCCLALAEPVRSEAALRHCLALSPSYAPAHGLLGLVRAVLGHPQETAEHCARAFALSPREPLRAIWYWAEAWAQLEMDAADAALLHAQRGIQANPDFPSCHLAAAVAAHRLGDAALAQRSVQALRAGGSFTSAEAVARQMPWMRGAAQGQRALDDLCAVGLPALEPVAGG